MFVYTAKKTLPTIALIVVLTLSFMVPWEARAQTDDPWGGMIIFTMPCTCSTVVTWVLVMGEVGGVFDYVEGTQMFREYSMPMTQWGLGFYWSSGPACWMGASPYCYLMSSQGMISSVTGSS